MTTLGVPHNPPHQDIQSVEKATQHHKKKSYASFSMQIYFETCGSSR